MINKNLLSKKKRKMNKKTELLLAAIKQNYKISIFDIIKMII